MELDFKNKTVLITGGEGGIGKTTTNQFLKLGAKVIVTTTKKEFINRGTNKKIYMYLDFNINSSFKNFLNNLKKIKKIDVLLSPKFFADITNSCAHILSYGTSKSSFSKQKR